MCEILVVTLRGTHEVRSDPVCGIPWCFFGFLHAGHVSGSCIGLLLCRPPPASACAGVGPSLLQLACICTTSFVKNVTIRGFQLLRCAKVRNSQQRQHQHQHQHQQHQQPQETEERGRDCLTSSSLSTLKPRRKSIGSSRMLLASPARALFSTRTFTFGTPTCLAMSCKAVEWVLWACMCQTSAVFIRVSTAVLH